MIANEKTELEYMLLRNYQGNGLIAREFLLDRSFVALEHLEQEKYYTEIHEDLKPKIKNFIQIDIISKMMMFIEDLAILSESFMLQRNFYDLLNDSSKDIGEMIRCFFEKISYISDEGIYKIISYATSGQISLDDKSAKVLDKHLNSNVTEVKRILREIGDFGIANHPLFKRFKHAGMPIFCGALKTSPDSTIYTSSVEVFVTI